MGGTPFTFRLSVNGIVGCRLNQLKELDLVSFRQLVRMERSLACDTLMYKYAGRGAFVV